MTMDEVLSKPSLESVLAALGQIRIHNAASEFAIHDAIHTVLRSNGIPLKREYRLGLGSVADFWIPGAGVVIEVKKGRPRSTADILRQVDRYAAHVAVRALVLVVEHRLPRHPDESSTGKPVRYVSLSQLWGGRTLIQRTRCTVCGEWNHDKSYCGRCGGPCC